LGLGPVGLSLLVEVASLLVADLIMCWWIV
jgi:hypothetical protein